MHPFSDLLGVLKGWYGTKCAHDCIMAGINALLQVQVILQSGTRSLARADETNHSWI
jgi:hypothetical protein